MRGGVAPAAEVTVGGAMLSRGEAQASAIEAVRD